jgi:hypothetical protein
MGIGTVMGLEQHRHRHPRIQTTGAHKPNTGGIADVGMNGRNGGGTHGGG